MGWSDNDWTLDIPEGIPGEVCAIDSNGIQWHQINGFPNYYVTDEGEIISFVNNRPRVMQTWPNQHGHRMLRLPGRTHKSVHRAVAEAFVYNPNNHPIVRHLNDDPTDNDWTNLAWGTAKDNREDMIRNGNDFRKGAYCFELDKHFRTCADAASYFEVARSMITNVCKGNVHSVKGYHLCYEDEIEEKCKDKEWLGKQGNFKPVKAINIKTGAILNFRSRKEATIELGVSDSGISNVLAGRIKQTGGWRFEEGEYI